MGTTSVSWSSLLPSTVASVSSAGVVGGPAPGIAGALTSPVVGSPLQAASSTPAVSQLGVSALLSAPVAATTGSPVLQSGAPSVSGFSLSPATEPFPRKLVDRVRSGQYVDMRDLLNDNIALVQQLGAFSSHSACLPALPGALRPRLREITTLPSWIYCFLAYIAMRSPDAATRDMLAYARLVVREAQRHGGTGWLDYDRVFRQQAALDPTLRWNTLQASIQAATLIGQAAGSGTICTLCREPDHTADHCALTYLQQPADRPSVGARPPTRSRYPARRRQEPKPLCASWNKGQCLYPSWCSYRHICATCHGQHRARDCGDTPADSEYKRGAAHQGQRQVANPPRTRS